MPLPLRRSGRELKAARRRAEEARRRHDAAIAECRAFLDRAQALSRIGVWRSDPGDDARLDWSAETYRIVGFGDARPELHLPDFLALVHPDDRPLVSETLASVREDGQSRTIEYRVTRPDGTEGWLQESVELVRDLRGRPLELTGVLRDVTEQRRVLEQLSHSHRMEVVGQFASTIAHDVNNLSTVIIGYAHLAASETRGREDPTEEIRQISKAADGIAALTRQLLAFSRRQALEPTLVDVNDAIEAIRPAVASLVGSAVELVIRPHDASALVRADPSQLEQVVLNLGLNARDATPSGGTITVEAIVAELDAHTCADGAALRAGMHVGLRVADTGVGMDDTTRQRCFEPFFTTKPIGRGTGLGLATVSSIAQRHGGGTDVDSAPGRGSAFTVWFPHASISARAGAAASGR